MLGYKPHPPARPLGIDKMHPRKVPGHSKQAPASDVKLVLYGRASRSTYKKSVATDNCTPVIDGRIRKTSGAGGVKIDTTRR